MPNYRTKRDPPVPRDVHDQWRSFGRTLRLPYIGQRVKAIYHRKDVPDKRDKKGKVISFTTSIECFTFPSAYTGYGKASMVPRKLRHGDEVTFCVTGIADTVHPYCNGYVC